MRSTIESMDKLRKAFDRHFPRPQSLDNAGCCVAKSQELALLKVLREELDEETLALPADHFCGCFATFEQASYFVPRLMELLAEAEEGFQWGCLDISFFRFLRDHREDYTSRGLWAVIEQCLTGILNLRTSTFRITHYDKAACKAKGWQIDHFDMVVGSEAVQQLLDGFFCPVLTCRPTEGTLTEWDLFFEQWATDESPSRIAHLLDVTKGGLEHERGEHALPPSYEARLCSEGFADMLIKRAEPAVLATGSPTWFGNLRRALSLD